MRKLVLDSAVARCLEALNIVDVRTGRADANETAMFARQLEYIMTETYDIEYPSLVARQLIPVDTRVPSGADSFTYRSFDKVGQARIVNNYAVDFPTVEVFGTETPKRLKSIGASYIYSIQEMRAAAFAGVPLEAKKADAARFAMETQLEDIAATGDSNSGLEGLANNAAIPSTALANVGTWAAKLAANNVAQVLADVNAMQAQIFNASKGVHQPDTLALGTAPYALLATSARSATYTEDSVLQYILKQSPWLKQIVCWPRLDTAGAGNAPRALMYERNPRNLGLIVSQEFEQLPPQPRNMAFIVPCHMRTGGVEIRYPKAFTYMDGTA